NLPQPLHHRARHHRHRLEWPALLWLAGWQQSAGGRRGRGDRDPCGQRRGRPLAAASRQRRAARRKGATGKPERKAVRCAIYTRKSTEHNLDLEFNSLDAQREACEAYVKSQAHEGWRLIADRYDDGAVSGASLDRSALHKLLADVGAGKINIVLVYKVDRLTRSLADFAKLVELFDQQGV